MSARSSSGRMRPPSEREPQSWRFRILSIDGGGIRGVMPAVLLAKLEAVLNSTLAAARDDPAEAAAAELWKGFDDVRVADCFHLVAGTSTGGLLAAGLTATGADGRPKLSAEDAVHVYKRHGRAIFRRPLLRNLLDHLNLLVPRYPLAQLRTVLEDPSVLGDGLLRNARTDVAITSYDTSLPGPRLFTRWGAPGAGTKPDSPSETMIDVSLATAAAPTYFDPEALQASRLVDGGVYAGNPALVAITMALRRTTDPVPVDPTEILMISLGTGAWETKLDYGWGRTIGWLRPQKGGEALLEALLGGESDFASEAAHMILNGWSATLLPGGAAGGGPTPWWDPNLSPAMVGGGPQFWRYQPSLPEPWALDDVSKLADLERIATNMTDIYASELQHLAEGLVRAGPVPA